MDDRTLLELAAKAAGWEKTKFDDRGWFYICTYPEPEEWELWNPLTDDGDALRLLAALPSLWQLSMKFGPMMGLEVAWGTGRGIAAYENPNNAGRLAAIRLVIVRAAAEIGLSKSAVSAPGAVEGDE